MRSDEFEERFRDCREMPEGEDPAYRSAFNQVIREAGGSVTIGGDSNPEVLERLSAAGEDDKDRRWINIGSSPMDARLAAFSELYADADLDQRKTISEFFRDEQLRELDIFVARAARLTEATGDSRWLRQGLAAACISGGRYDFRDLIASLGILRCGAERAGIASEPFFQEALEMSPPAGSPEAPKLREILLTVMSYPAQTLKDLVQRFGPPEWREEEKPRAEKKPWWKLW